MRNHLRAAPTGFWVGGQFPFVLAIFSFSWPWARTFWYFQHWRGLPHKSKNIFSDPGVAAKEKHGVQKNSHCRTELGARTPLSHCWCFCPVLCKMKSSAKAMPYFQHAKHNRNVAVWFASEQRACHTGARSIQRWFTPEICLLLLLQLQVQVQLQLTTTTMTLLRYHLLLEPVFKGVFVGALVLPV